MSRSTEGGQPWPTGQASSVGRHPSVTMAFTQTMGFLGTLDLLKATRQRSAMYLQRGGRE